MARPAKGNIPINPKIRRRVNAMIASRQSQASMMRQVPTVFHLPGH
jgi:hypothetical protein